MERIAIIGSSGAGKSTLARKLGEMTGLPVYHLDVLHWEPNWQMTSKEEQSLVQEELVKRDKWIIDGNYGGTMDIRLSAADTVIFLDLNRLRCVFRVIKRRFQYRNKERPDMRQGNRERIDFGFYKWTWNFNRDKRPEIVAKLEQLPPEKDVIWLHTSRDVDDFLNTLKKG